MMVLHLFLLFECNDKHVFCMYGKLIYKHIESKWYITFRCFIEGQTGAKYREDRRMA